MSQNQNQNQEAIREVPTTFEYNGHKFTFDIRDADDAEKYEAAFDEMQISVEKLPKAGRVADHIRSICVIYRDFFDAIWGTGAGVKVCGEKDIISVCDDAFMDFQKKIQIQSRDISRRKNDYGRQFANREQRRKNKKNRQNGLRIVEAET